jgi:DNA polymerase
MRLLTLDVESFYSTEFSLRKITVPEYILSSQWETICLGAKFDDGPVETIDGPDVQAFFDGIDPADTMTISHNSLFDACVFAWRYGFVPARMIDTMGMARMLRGHVLKGVSLETVAEYFHLPPKGHTIAQVKGMHRAEIMGQPALWQAFQSYCKHDVDLTYQIFNKLAPEMPSAQFAFMDLVLRAAVVPQFVIDHDLLAAHYADVVADKEKLMREANADRDSLMSNDKFAARLTELGVEIGTKPSPSNFDIDIPAFAKTDQFMSDLLEHEDTQVQALAAARLGVKSTLEEKRTQRLLAIAALPWARFMTEDGDGRVPLRLLPIPLRLAGAHTQRLSGDWKINAQNLPAGRDGKPTKLRHSLRAPHGYKVVVGDLGQMHARITSWLSGSPLLEQFRNKQDPYNAQASNIFDRPINRKLPSDAIEGQIGKAAVLGLGFGAAAPKFYGMVIRAVRAGGGDVEALKKVWTLELAEKAVKAYRRSERKTVSLWYTLEQVLATSWVGKSGPVRIGPVEIGYGYVRAPSGLEMRYVPSDNKNGRDKFYTYGKRPHKIYGAAFLENIVQFLEVEIMQHAAIRLAKRGIRFALQSHDELVFVVPDEAVDTVKAIVVRELTRPPSWGMDLPLTASVNHGQSYGQAK